MPGFSHSTGREKVTWFSPLQMTLHYVAMRTLQAKAARGLGLTRKKVRTLVCLSARTTNGFFWQVSTNAPYQCPSI